MFKSSARWLSGLAACLLLAGLLATGCSNEEKNSAGPQETKALEETSGPIRQTTETLESGTASNTASNTVTATASGETSLPGEATAPAPVATAAANDAAEAAKTGATDQQETEPASGKPAESSVAGKTASGKAASPKQPAATSAPAHSPGEAAPAVASGKSPAPVKPSATPALAAPSAKSPAPAASPAANSSAAQAQAITLSITGDKEHGTILSPTEVELKEGESVLELLKRYTRKHKMQMEYQGTKGYAYVNGIDNLYEFDNGPESGWKYRVNGAFPDQSAGSYTLAPGDTVDWLYTLDMGKDIGASAP